MTEANRWLLYAALFGVLVLLLRDDRLGAVVVGAGRSGDPGARRLPRCPDARRQRRRAVPGGRLNEPLGYVNGQAGYLLLGSGR